MSTVDLIKANVFLSCVYRRSDSATAFAELLKATESFQQQMDVDPHQATKMFFTAGWRCSQALDSKGKNAVGNALILLGEILKAGDEDPSVYH